MPWLYWNPGLIFNKLIVFVSLELLLAASSFSLSKSAKSDVSGPRDGIELVLLLMVTEVVTLKTLAEPRIDSYVAARKPPRMSSAQGLSPLGSFGKLPPEIRCNIWRFLMPQSQNPHRSQSKEESEKLIVSGICDPPQNRLAILCASRELYEEVSEELYRRELCFCICPGQASFTVKDVPSSLARNFVNTPLDRFRIIAIEIQAPESSHPEQVIEGVLSVIEFVSLIFEFFKRLEQRPGPPGPVFLHQINISFLNRTCATWFRAGVWQRSLPGNPTCDLVNILCPFRLLSKIGSVKIHVPDGLEDDEFITNCIAVAVVQINTRIWSADELCQNLAMWSAACGGKTAQTLSGDEGWKSPQGLRSKWAIWGWAWEMRMRGDRFFADTNYKLVYFSCWGLTTWEAQGDRSIKTLLEYKGWLCFYWWVNRVISDGYRIGIEQGKCLKIQPDDNT